MLEDLIKQLEDLPLHSILIDCPLNLSKPLWHVIIRRQDDWLNHRDNVIYTSAGGDLTKVLQDVIDKLTKEEYTVVRRS